MSLPTARDVPMLADSLANAAAWIRRHGEAALEARPAQLVAAGAARAESAGAVSGGDRSDPTMAAAVATVTREEAAVAELGAMQAELRSAMATTHDMAHQVVTLIGRIQGATVPPRRPAASSSSKPASCCELRCEDPASPKCAGRCEPCYRWRRRWSEAHGGEPAPSVPADVIEARVAVRENRKIRVSGPAQGFV